MQEFTRDWFSRRKEDAYTYTDDRNRFFNWDAGRKSYSSFFTRSSDTLSTSAKMIGSMFRVIGVPKKFNFTANSERNNETIQVPLQMLKNENGQYLDPDPEVLDAFYGASIQNAALAAMQTSSDYGKTLACRDTSKKSFGLKDYMFSILNTERIDKKLASRLPGYLKFVQKYKDYSFDKNYKPVDPSASPQKRLLDLVTRMLRYPAHITEEELKEFDKPLKQIERLLKKNGGIPDSTEDCMSMASSLSNIIYKYKEDEETPPPPPPGKDPGDDEEGKDPGEDGPISIDSGSPGSDDESEDDGETKETKESEEESKPNESLTKQELNDIAKELMNLLNPEDTSEDDEKEFKEVFDEFVEGMDEDDKSSLHEDDVKDQDGNIISGTVCFMKAESNKRRYTSALKNIDTTKAAVLKKLFERKSKDYQFSLKSMRSGRLDTNKIAEAKQSVPTVYERYGQVKTNKVCIGVLIDESGSMGGEGKIEKAQEAAIFINEVFKNMRDVQMYIYGHTADETVSRSSKVDTSIRVYREPGFSTDAYALGSVEARSNNRDGDAILATAKRIRKHTQDPGILFVISDGAPSASGYGGKTAIEDTRRKVTLAQNLGFQVIQIAIESYVPSNKMFDYFVKMTNIKNLPKDLTSYVSRKVDKLVKEKVTL